MARGDAYDSKFSMNIKQRKENVEVLFYRLLSQVVQHDRDRALSNGLDLSEDLSVCFIKFGLFT